MLRQTFTIGTGDDPEMTDENGENVAQTLSPILSALSYLAERGVKWDKLIHTPAMKAKGYVFSNEFGKDEMRTAKALRSLAKMVNAEMSLEKAIETL